MNECITMKLITQYKYKFTLKVFARKFTESNTYNEDRVSVGRWKNDKIALRTVFF